jgi:hypothetical protein
MPIKRTRFPLSDTGTFGDTGFLNGELAQVRWVPTTDTGHTLTLTVMPSEGDTGHGFNVLVSDSGFQSDQWTSHPRAKVVDVNQAQDTGMVPYVAAGDKLRVKIVSTGTGTTSGTLYVYAKD